jgi:hypothetical protein
MQAVRFRAWQLVIGSEGEISYAEAERAAAKELAAQLRPRKRRGTLHQAAPATEGITIHNAREVLLSRLAGTAARLRASAEFEQRAAPRVRKKTGSITVHSAAPPVPHPNKENRQTEPQPEPVIGVFTGRSVTTALRIDDSDFPPLLHSVPTQNWRQSIADNERRARERRSRWIG